MNEDFSHQFKKTLAKFSTGVTVVTTNYKEENYGVTVSSFASLSLNPALILFNLDQNSSTFEAFTNAQYFNVNILSKSQKLICDNFAQRQKDKFKDIHFKIDENNISFFKENIALVKCKFHQTFNVGDHNIIIGQVIDCEYNDEYEPLIYFNSKVE